MTEKDPSGSTEAERKRRLREKVFGEVIPETTSDEQRDPDERASGGDDWLERQVPPHHG